MIQDDYTVYKQLGLPEMIKRYNMLFFTSHKEKSKFVSSCAMVLPSVIGLARAGADLRTGVSNRA